MPAIPERDLYLGFSPAELAESPYARFFRPQMAPLSEPVKEALLTGPVAHERMWPVERAGDLLADGDWPVETGYSIGPDGSARISVLTPMPGVEPAMWDWWFAWHGSHAQRYKLWHPQAHVHVVWSDGRSDLTHYVGRTSNVVEYVGAGRLGLTIRFVAPSTLGLDEGRLAAAGATAICARGGLAGTPMETGWLIHHVRPVPGGAEMRSRFWLGGANLRPRGMPGPLGAALGGVASRLAPLNPAQAADLLVHCAQEMSHLAAILPDLHAAFAAGPDRQKGQVL
ncbi:DAPG hydrolase family protein [Phenylobacterium aquaticum]|uniref:DAPG hydrolase family protein n=1 Tax=Phenylobacterium aquaticum TaxID=1763816 RepID=UPI001F5C2397|nr:hypothetical protein [Phenylobacterium aquaticum]MCI3134655.1 hypothetical protein [Phenylobacterium aquaticum]